ncbi:ribosome silencing factor [Hydrococcus rivularis NIES-593]|uniref:Ribosomal silencing factor RsfS n=1 Tax=Hydrococcus rivularis NIES-593 TaxID=1921803 RepID=A0A1U7H8J8_9CYAN|nr:ribosome silencing factor [Hydrococcus rivularis]OKH19458.1 ribosome silencing factor [Hydrococcus rivularis NIES-593]
MTNRDFQKSPHTNLSTVAITSQTSDDSSHRLAETIVQAADDRKASDIVVLKVTDISYLTDYFVIATGFSRTQVRAISDSIEEKVARECHKNPLRVEGKGEGSWILHDYGDVIVHIFMPQEREFYNLEAFWGHAERINIPSLYNSSQE